MSDTLYAEQPYLERVKENFKQNWAYKIYLWIKRKWLRNLQKKNFQR